MECFNRWSIIFYHWALFLIIPNYQNMNTESTQIRLADPEFRLNTFFFVANLLFQRKRRKVADLRICVILTFISVKSSQKPTVFQTFHAKIEF